MMFDSAPVNNMLRSQIYNFLFDALMPRAVLFAVWSYKCERPCGIAWLMYCHQTVELISS